MKCIKTKDGEVKRVSDRDAETLVSSGAASYIPKHEYKEATRKK